MVHNKTSNKQNWRTPDYIISFLEQVMSRKFSVDLASDEDNAKCKRRYGEDNSFTNYKKEEGDFVWCNPPFNMKDQFIEKFRDEKIEGCLLLPSDTGSKWFKDAYEACSYCILLTGRISFLDFDNKPISGNPASSAIFVFKTANNKTSNKIVFMKTTEIKRRYNNTKKE